HQHPVPVLHHRLNPPHWPITIHAKSLGTAHYRPRHPNNGFITPSSIVHRHRRDTDIMRRLCFTGKTLHLEKGFQSPNTDAAITPTPPSSASDITMARSSPLHHQA
ncbi:hypothetical protein U1Q18_000500, partial [Sarracenia purpurea var. burkii]